MSSIAREEDATHVEMGPVDGTDNVLEPRKEQKIKSEIPKEIHENDSFLSSGEMSKGEKVVYDDVAEQTDKICDVKGIELSKEDYGEETIKKVDKKRSTKKQKKTMGHDSDAEVSEFVAEESVETDSNGGSKTERRKGKKRKKIENNSEKHKEKSKSKKVKFSDTHKDKQKQLQEDNLVRGKRYTPEEDEILREAVLKYIKRRGLGEDGLKMVLNCSSHGLRKCWNEIGECLPNRPHHSIYYRAHILFERGEKRVWTPEEIKILRESHEKYGNNWKLIAEQLGKHRIHVKDAWRRVKFGNKDRGTWNQEEYQNLYDLVNLDLQMKVVCKEKKSQHGMLRDNIPWRAISDKLSSRSDASCCRKWYNQLTSSLVAEQKWSNGDDYRLVGALYELDAACEEDVDWENLVEHRPGDICRKRWNQMVLHIGHHGSKPFAEQVETLANRYCPDLAEIREAWDKKPVVP